MGFFFPRFGSRYKEAKDCKKLPLDSLEFEVVQDEPPELCDSRTGLVAPASSNMFTMASLPRADATSMG